MKILSFCSFLGFALLNWTNVSHAELILSLASTMNPNGSLTDFGITGVRSQINFGSGAAGDADGFYNAANTSQQFGSADMFPNETNFAVGTLSYSNAALTNVGVEVAPITILNPNLFWAAGSSTTDINDANGLDLWFFGNNSSIVFGGLDASDQVTLTNGIVTGINLTTTATINADFGTATPFPFNGTFSIIGNQFSFQIDQTVASVPTAFGNFPTQFVADLRGTVNAVSAIPEPASGVLASIAAITGIRLNHIVRKVG
jgi:hypothetical protein